MAPRILIAGTGALASLFAARLSAAGVHVTLLGSWNAAIKAIQSSGVRLIQADAPEQVFPVTVLSDPARCESFEYALVLVKSWQTNRSADQLKVCLASEGLALTLQNGLGNREKLMAQLGRDRAALGVTTTGATLVSPGCVRAGGEGSIIVEQHPLILPLVQILRGAGFAVEITDDADSLAWSKLVINAAINPLTALLQVPNGELLKRPSARTLMSSLANETAQVAGQSGVTLSFTDPVAAAEAVAAATASNHSSMYQDLQRGAPTEIEAICGAVLKAGEELGVATPVMETIYQLVKAKADRNQ